MALKLIRADQNFLRMHFEKILLICNKLKLKLMNKIMAEYNVQKTSD